MVRRASSASERRRTAPSPRSECVGGWNCYVTETVALGKMRNYSRGLVHMIGRPLYKGRGYPRAEKAARSGWPRGLFIVFGQPGFESRGVISFFMQHTKSSYRYYRLLSYIHTRSPIHTLLYTNTYTHWFSQSHRVPWRCQVLVIPARSRVGEGSQSQPGPLGKTAKALRNAAFTRPARGRR